MVAQKPLEDQLIGLSGRPGSPLEVHAEPTARWVRAVVDGVAVADSKQVGHRRGRAEMAGGSRVEIHSPDARRPLPSRLRRNGVVVDPT
jgi:hypothetical protein